MKNTLTFDPIEHRYTLNGLPIPSVTNRLKRMFPTRFSGIPKDVLAHAAERGTAIHVGIELLAKDDLDWDTVDKEIRPYIEAWQAFLKERQYRIVWSEVRVASKKHWFAGTLDHLAIDGHQRIIIDVKTGEIEEEGAVSVRLQTAAYGIAWDEMNPKTKHDRRMCVRLTSDGKFHVIEHNDREDYQAFLRGLSHVNWVDRALTEQKK